MSESKNNATTGSTKAPKKVNFKNPMALMSADPETVIQIAKAQGCALTLGQSEKMIVNQTLLKGYTAGAKTQEDLDKIGGAFDTAAMVGMMSGKEGKAAGGMDPMMLMMMMGQGGSGDGMSSMLPLLMAQGGDIDPMTMMMLSGGKMDPMTMMMLNQKKDGKAAGGIDPMMMMLMNQNKDGGQGGFDPMMMMLMNQGKEGGAGGLDPMTLMMLGGGDIDPMTMMMMNGGFGGGNSFI